MRHSTWEGDGYGSIECEDCTPIGYNKPTTVDQVKSFHKAFQVPPRDYNSLEDREFRLRLITEEFEEVAYALGFRVYIQAYSSGAQPDKANLLKELCDLKYVTDGTAIAFDLDIDTAFDRVHKSNMSKLDEDGKPIFREDGKVLKSSNYKEPDLGDLV